MKKIVLAVGVSIFALAAPASAADGWYMGIAGTYTSNNSSTAVLTGPFVGSGAFATSPNRVNVTTSTANDLSNDAYGAEIMFGYKMHLAPRWILGFEADASAFDGEITRTATGNYTDQNVAPGTESFTLNTSFSQQWISTIRAKIGYDITPDLNGYVTAGLAMTDVDLRTTFSDTWPVNERYLAETLQANEFKFGYAYGGGIDWALGGSTSLRVEYIRTEIGDIQTTRVLRFNNGTLTPGPNVLSNNVQLQNELFRLGLNWELNF